MIVSIGIGITIIEYICRCDITLLSHQAKDGSMAINIRCEACKSDLKLTAKKCKKCDHPVSNRNKTYRVIVWVGKKRVSRIVSNLELARDIEAKLKVEKARGEYNIEKKKPAPTLDEVWIAYLPWAQANKKSWKSDRSCYEKHLEPSLGKKPLDGISPSDIDKLIFLMKETVNRRGVTYSDATIKHQLVLLNRLYNFASQRRLYKGQNPCADIKKPKLNNERTEYLSKKEMTRLNKVLDTWPDKVVSSIIKFAMYTGLRRGELLKLQWSDIDQDKKIIYLRDPKGIKDQALPVSNEAIQVLKKLPQQTGCSWVFHGKDGNQRVEFRSHWNKIKAASKLPQGFRFHGLRHNYASHLVSAGVDLYTVQKLLTHKNATTTQRYAHLSNDTLRNAVNLSASLLKPSTSRRSKGNNNK